MDKDKQIVEKVLPMKKTDDYYKKAAEFVITTYKTWEVELKEGQTHLQLWQWLKLHDENKRLMTEFDFTRPKPPKDEEGENYPIQPEPAQNYFAQIIERAKRIKEKAMTNPKRGEKK